MPAFRKSLLAGQDRVTASQQEPSLLRMRVLISVTVHNVAPLCLGRRGVLVGYITLLTPLTVRLGTMVSGIAPHRLEYHALLISAPPVPVSSSPPRPLPYYCILQ